MANTRPPRVGLGIAVVVALFAAVVYIYPWHRWLTGSEPFFPPDEVIEFQEADSLFGGSEFEVLHPQPGYVLTGDFIVAYVNVSLHRLSSSTGLRISLQEIVTGARNTRLIHLDRDRAEALGPQGDAVIVAQRIVLDKKGTDYILSAALLSSVSPTASVLIEATPVRFTSFADGASDWDVFWTWLRNHGAKWNVEMRAETTPAGDAYRKAVATKEMAPGTVVAEIPKSVTVDYPHILHSPLMRWIGAGLLQQMNDEVVFAAYLSWCMKFPEHCPHTPYIRSLPSPETMPHLAIWWTEEEMALFEGTSLSYEIQASKDHLESLAAEVEELLEVSEELSKTIDRYSIEYAIVATTTRCWGDGNEYDDGQKRLRLCPLMDLLNHHNKANYIDSDKVGYLRSLTNFTLHAGDEAWMNYGEDKSANFKLLLYGWLGPVEEVRICRVINLPSAESLPPATADIRQKLIEELEAEVDPYENHCIGVGTHDDLKEFMTALRMVHFTHEDIHGRSVQRMARDMNEHMGALTVENEKRVLADLEEVFTSLKKTLLEHSTPIDEALANGSRAEPNMLRRAAAVFRLGELRVCDWVLLQIHKQRNAMRDKFKPKEPAGMTGGMKGGNKGKAIFKKKEGPASKPKPPKRAADQGGHKKDDSPPTPAPKAPAA